MKKVLETLLILFCGFMIGIAYLTGKFEHRINGLNMALEETKKHCNELREYELKKLESKYKLKRGSND